MSKGSKSANYVVVHYPRNLVDHRCVQPESFYVLFYREEKAQEAALRNYHLWYDDPIDVRLPDGSYLTLVLENKVLVSPEATLGDVVKQVQTYKTPEGLLFSSTTPCPISILPQSGSIEDVFATNSTLLSTRLADIPPTTKKTAAVLIEPDTFIERVRSEASALFRGMREVEANRTFPVLGIFTTNGVRLCTSESIINPYEQLTILPYTNDDHPAMRLYRRSWHRCTPLSFVDELLKLYARRIIDRAQRQHLYVTATTLLLWWYQELLDIYVQKGLQNFPDREETNKTLLYTEVDHERKSEQRKDKRQVTMCANSISSPTRESASRDLTTPTTERSAGRNNSNKANDEDDEKKGGNCTRTPQSVDKPPVSNGARFTHVVNQFFKLLDEQHRMIDPRKLTTSLLQREVRDIYRDLSHQRPGMLWIADVSPSCEKISKHSLELLRLAIQNREAQAPVCTVTHDNVFRPRAVQEAMGRFVPKPKRWQSSAEFIQRIEQRTGMRFDIIVFITDTDEMVTFHDLIRAGYRIILLTHDPSQLWNWTRRLRMYPNQTLQFYNQTTTDMFLDSLESAVRILTNEDLERR